MSKTLMHTKMSQLGSLKSFKKQNGNLFQFLTFLALSSTHL
jgi:hypothetical protein